MLKRRSFLAAMLGGAMILASACGGPASPTKGKAGGDTVRIGVTNPMTGPAAHYGERAKQGAELALEVVNEKGVLGGKKVELIYADDQSTPQGGALAINKLIDENQVDIVSGGVNSSIAIGQKDLTRGKILHLVTSAQADEVTEKGHPWLFRLNNTVSANARGFHDFIAQKLKPQKVAFLVENTDFGKNTTELLTKQWDAPGSPQLVAIEKFEQSQTDFTILLSKIKSLNPDMVFICNAAPPQTATILKQLEQVGVKAQKTLSPGLLNNDVIKLTGSKEALEGIISADVWIPEVNNPQNKDFVERFQKKYNELPDKVAELSYESIIILAQAIDQAGTASDYDKLARILRQNAWKTPRGEVRFDNKGQNASPINYQIVKDTRIVPYQ